MFWVSEDNKQQAGCALEPKTYHTLKTATFWDPEGVSGINCDIGCRACCCLAALGASRMGGIDVDNEERDDDVAEKREGRRRKQS